MLILCKMRYLHIVAFILERVSSNLDCVSHVNSCPCSLEEWERRSSVYNCSGLNYTCMLTFNNTLAEACIPDYPVKPGALGCPFLQTCYGSTPIIALASEFKQCPPNKTDCPNQNHTGYSLTKLYEFPLCIRRNASICSKSSFPPSDDNKNGHLPIILGCLFGSLFALFFVFIGMYCYRRRRKWSRRMRREEDFISFRELPLFERRTESLLRYTKEERLESLLRYTKAERLAGRLKNHIYRDSVDAFRKDIQEIKEQTDTDIHAVIEYEQKGGVLLSHAIYQRQSQMVDILLREGVDFELMNEGENPIQYGLFHTGCENQSSVIQESGENPIHEGLFDTPFMMSYYAGEPSKNGTKETTDFLQSLLIVQDKYKIDEAKFDKFKEIIAQAIKEFKEIPQEILDMGPKALRNYRQNIKKGALPSKYIRCMVVGHYGVGKTTLIRGLLEKDQNNIQSTDGIDVYKEMCYIKDGTWEVLGKDKSFHSEDIFGLDNVIQVDFWDFAGQAIYYSTHPTYFSDRCLYLLVIDVSRSTAAKIDDLDIDPSRKSPHDIMDFLHHWISTILHYSGGTWDGYPKIIIIGTHRDKCSNRMSNLKKGMDKIEKDIRTAFKEHIKTGHLICSMTNFINAKCLSSCEREGIQTLIKKEGVTYPSFGYKIPKSWIDVNRKIRSEFKEQKVSIINLDTLKKVWDELGITRGDEDVSLFLDFYTSLGQILYFKESTLSNYVILEPMWLIDAMRSLITKDENFKHSEKIGKVTKEQILQCLRFNDPQYENNFEHVMKVLDRLDFVCNPKTYDDQGSHLMSSFYYIPSIFKESGLNVPYPRSHITEQIIYSFEKEILPPAVYHRLVCSFISMWKVHEQHLYCETVQLQVQDNVIVRFERQQHEFVLKIFFTEKRQRADIADIIKMIHSNVQQAFHRVIRYYTRSRTNVGPSVKYKGKVSLDDDEKSTYSARHARKNTGKVLSMTEWEMPLKDIHLIRICCFLTPKKQEIMLQTLKRGGIAHHETSFEKKHRPLLCLNEWRTSVITMEMNA